LLAVPFKLVDVEKESHRLRVRHKILTSCRSGSLFDQRLEWRLFIRELVIETLIFHLLRKLETCMQFVKTRKLFNTIIRYRKFMIEYFAALIKMRLDREQNSRMTDNANTFLIYKINGISWLDMIKKRTAKKRLY